MFLSTWVDSNDELNPKIIYIIILIIVFFSKILTLKSSKKVYLVNFACFQPKKSQQVTREFSIKRTPLLEPTFTDKSLKIIEKLVMSSGIGDSTYAPEPLLVDPPDFSLEAARREAEAAIFGSVELLLRATGVKVEDIGVLVVNCSVFNPIPSLTSMVVNRFKLRDDIKSFCLTGMGCSASLIGIDLAGQLLQVHSNTYAMVVSTEVTGQNFYRGNDPHKLPINCVMRVGGAAILLSNRQSDRHISKYQLIHSVRTNTSNSDTSYGCISHEEDQKGRVGITVTKDLVDSASNSVKVHIATLGSLILPISEQLRFKTNDLVRKLMIKMKMKMKLMPYSPNFGRAIDHFFPHVGARLILDVLEKRLSVDVEAARMTLYRFGNTSSSSVWYEMAYTEAKGKVKRGDILWEIAFGSGFKCNSLIWRALKNVEAQEKYNPWSYEIDNFPVQLERIPANISKISDCYVTN